MELSNEQLDIVRSLFSHKRFKYLLRNMDRRGREYGQLKVLEIDLQRTAQKPGDIYWWCLCSCGKKKSIAAKNLQSGNSESCGCASFLPPGEGAFNAVYAGIRTSVTRRPKRNLAWELSREFVRKLTSSACHYCGAAPARTVSGPVHGQYLWNGIDRKDSALGYVEDNCLSCCTRCNVMKGDMPYDEFFRHLAKILSYHEVSR